MKSDIFSRVEIPPTCKLRWDHVDPNQKQWFCSHCQHYVHNLSAMTRSEARKFMRLPCSGRRCVSFLQDQDGRTVFRKTPSWLHSMGASLAWLVSAAFVFLISGCGSAPQKQSAGNAASVSDLKPQNEQASVQTRQERKRRWTGY